MKELRTMEERANDLNNIMEFMKIDAHVAYRKVSKNNLDKEGYVISSSSVNTCPILYYSEDWYDMSDCEVVEHIQNIVKEQCFNTDINSFLTKEYILKNVRERVVSMDNLNYVKENDFFYFKKLDLLVMYYIPVEIEGANKGTITLTCRILNMFDWEDYELILAAECNMHYDLVIKSMTEVMMEMTGLIDVDFEPNELPEDTMYVIKNKYDSLGAAAFLVPSVIEEIKKTIKKDFVILPSSIHEVLAVPVDEINDKIINDFKDMVENVNSTVCNAEDVLSYNIYYYSLATGGYLTF